MRRILISEILSETIVIDGAKAHHLARVLRVKAGEQLSVVDCAGVTAIAEVTDVQADRVVVRVTEAISNSCEPQSRVSLALALLKNDKLEWIIQKAVELGVHEITLFNGQNSVSKPDADSMTKKIIRLEKIAVAAVEQCGRSKVPKIYYEPKLAQALEKLSESPKFIALHEGEAKWSLHDQLHAVCGAAVALIIGPEGGLAEAELADVRGITTASLGPRVLRAETAALAALTIALSEFGDLG